MSSSDAWPEPVSMYDNLVSVVPLEQTHCADLAEATADGELYKLWYTSVPAPDSVATEIDRRLGCLRTSLLSKA